MECTYEGTWSRWLSKVLPFLRTASWLGRRSIQVSDLVLRHCNFWPELPAVALKYLQCVFKTPKSCVQVCVYVLCGGRGIVGRECGAWQGRMLSIYCPFEVDAIVILIFHGRRWTQKRLSNLPQVPVAIITAFFMVAWQRFLSWQDLPAPSYSSFFPDILFSPSLTPPPQMCCRSGRSTSS